MINSDIHAVILAGGVGSRFHPYTEIIPKPMIPIGEKEKPVLEVIVKWIRQFGITNLFSSSTTSGGISTTILKTALDSTSI